MRIGIDCRSLMIRPYGERGGIEYYTHSLIKHLLKIDKENSYVLFFDHLVQEKPYFEHPNVSIRYFPFSEYKRYLPFTYSHMLMAGFLQRENLDIFHSPAHVVPLFYPGKSILTIRNLAMFKHPEWFSKDYLPQFPSELLSRSLFTMKVLLPQSIKKAHSIITFCEDTKQDIVKLFKVPAKRITVVYPGIDDDNLLHYDPLVDKMEIASRFGIVKDYIFYIGTIEQRKNLVGLVQAYYALLLEQPDLVRYQLILAGEKGAKYDELFEAIDVCNKDLEKRGPIEWSRTVEETERYAPIRYVGPISYEEKSLLLRNASVFVYPSLYESFCSTLLRAMRHDVPVIASRIKPLVEVAGSAALYINPTKVDDMRKALHTILEKKDLRDRLIESGKSRSQKFQWQKAAEQTAQLYKQVAKSR